jgi:hypothetical protein
MGEQFVVAFIKRHVSNYENYYNGNTHGYKSNTDMIKDISALGVEFFEAMLNKTARAYVSGHGKYTYVTSCNNNEVEEAEEELEYHKNFKGDHLSLCIYLDIYICIYT